MNEYVREILVRIFYTVIVLGILAFLSGFFCSCTSIPTESEPQDTTMIEVEYDLDTDYFEIETSKVGWSNPTDFGRMNQWRIIIDDDSWRDNLDSLWVDSVKFALELREDLPEQRVGFWYAAPVHGVYMEEGQKFIEYTFPVGWKSKVYSCGVFTDTLYGEVRLTAKIYGQMYVYDD
jgi:hypothetical protein